MRVEIIDIADRSGSMRGLRNDVIGGFNTLLHDQKKLDGEAKFTQVQFDDKYELNFAGKDIKDVQPLTLDTYAPRGSTALLDAIGRTLNEQGERIAKEGWAEKVIVCIRTDGAENSSREFTLPQVKQMILHAQAHGWIFIFSAANQDAFATASQYGISGAFTRSFTATGQGVAESYAATNVQMANLRAEPNVTNLAQYSQNVTNSPGKFQPGNGDPVKAKI